MRIRDGKSAIEDRAHFEERTQDEDAFGKEDDGRTNGIRLHPVFLTGQNEL